MVTPGEIENGIRELIERIGSTGGRVTRITMSRATADLLVDRGLPPDSRVIAFVGIPVDFNEALPLGSFVTHEGQGWCRNFYERNVET